MAQIEVSTSCNASCIYCPRTVLRSDWISKFMNLRLYRKVIGELLSMGSINYVHLQGWGEPLLHPNFMDMIGEIRGKVDFGLTTNGLLLNEHYASKLVSLGINVIAVTFAGANALTHNVIRVGCDFNVVVNNVKRLIETRNKLRSGVRVVASFIALSMNIHELPDFVYLCHKLGIDEIVIDNLSYILNKYMLRWRAFTDPMEQELRVFKRVIDITLRRAKELGIKVFPYSLSCWELIECPERPTETIFIGVNGDVSPCVFLNLPTRGDSIPRCFMGKCFRVEKTIFGNADKDNIINIWNDEDYKEFRYRFIRRRSQGPNWEYGIDLMPPSQCITCYRLYGV
ncbi:cofactor modifying protein (cmo) [Vulcanisaeta moutnovskia 768-28]|uniref:Cofactor modifying protein (Cmo) n=1 Tax=Vulcanisaeta moutnovskia (strain 768-28) TaxID=985053 RepID=F0QWF2_VULM7|nr:radical SAM protein [Vulcanisaeta moutnovskia]ADY01000.1 cofactor modifying protein (cmo) [Vulcanisaeta moutnovskia 768-28]